METNASTLVNTALITGGNGSFSDMTESFRQYRRSVRSPKSSQTHLDYEKDFVRSLRKHEVTPTKEFLARQQRSIEKRMEKNRLQQEKENALLSGPFAHLHTGSTQVYDEPWKQNYREAIAAVKASFASPNTQPFPDHLRHRLRGPAGNDNNPNQNGYNNNLRSSPSHSEEIFHTALSSSGKNGNYRGDDDSSQQHMDNNRGGRRTLKAAPGCVEDATDDEHYFSSEHQYLGEIAYETSAAADNQYHNWSGQNRQRYSGGDDEYGVGDEEVIPQDPYNDHRHSRHQEIRSNEEEHQQQQQPSPINDISGLLQKYNKIFNQQSNRDDDDGAAASFHATTPPLPFTDRGSQERDQEREREGERRRTPSYANANAYDNRSSPEEFQRRSEPYISPNHSPIQDHTFLQHHHPYAPPTVGAALYSSPTTGSTAPQQQPQQHQHQHQQQHQRPNISFPSAADILPQRMDGQLPPYLPLDYELIFELERRQQVLMTQRIEILAQQKMANMSAYDASRNNNPSSSSPFSSSSMNYLNQNWFTDSTTGSSPYGNAGAAANYNRSSSPRVPSWGDGRSGRGHNADGSIRSSSGGGGGGYATDGRGGRGFDSYEEYAAANDYHHDPHQRDHQQQDQDRDQDQEQDQPPYADYGSYSRQSPSYPRRADYNKPSSPQKYPARSPPIQRPPFVPTCNRVYDVPKHEAHTVARGGAVRHSSSPVGLMSRSTSSVSNELYRGGGSTTGSFSSSLPYDSSGSRGRTRGDGGMRFPADTFSSSLRRSRSADRVGRASSNSGSGGSDPGQYWRMPRSLSAGHTRVATAEAEAAAVGGRKYSNSNGHGEQGHINGNGSSHSHNSSNRQGPEGGADEGGDGRRKANVNSVFEKNALLAEDEYYDAIEGGTGTGGAFTTPACNTPTAAQMGITSTVTAAAAAVAAALAEEQQVSENDSAKSLKPTDLGAKRNSYFAEALGATAAPPFVGAPRDAEDEELQSQYQRQRLVAAKKKLLNPQDEHGRGDNASAAVGVREDMLRPSTSPSSPLPFQTLLPSRELPAASQGQGPFRDLASPQKSPWNVPPVDYYGSKNSPRNVPAARSNEQEHVVVPPTSTLADKLSPSSYNNNSSNVRSASPSSSGGGLDRYPERSAAAAGGGGMSPSGNNGRPSVPVVKKKFAWGDEEASNLLRDGVVLQKFGRFGGAKPRLFMYVPMTNELQWRATDSAGKSSSSGAFLGLGSLFKRDHVSSIPLSSISEIRLGSFEKSSSVAAVAAGAPKASLVEAGGHVDPNTCFAIVSDVKTLCLVADSPNQRSLIVKGFSSLLLKSAGKSVPIIR